MITLALALALLLFCLLAIVGGIRMATKNPRLERQARQAERMNGQLADCLVQVYDRVTLSADVVPEVAAIRDVMMPYVGLDGGRVEYLRTIAKEVHKLHRGMEKSIELPN